MRRKLLFAGLLVLASLSLCIVAAEAGSNRYTENFTSNLFCDTLGTTAWRDTVAGELKLYPFVPTLVGAYDTPGYAYGVDISGAIALVADGASGLLLIDIGDPAAPALVGTYNTPGIARGLTIEGGFAFVADYGSGLQVIDISNPASPALVGTYDTPGTACGVTVSGDYAYVTDTGSGLQVINISDLANPALVGTYDTPGNASGVAISGDHAYVADGASGLQVIDVSDPSSPMLVGTYDTPGTATGIVVAGDWAFLADGSSGLQMIDITDPTNPTLLGTYDTPGLARNVTVSGDIAFVADNTSGLQVIDIGDPATPALVGTYYTQGPAYCVIVSGEHAFVADYSSGLEVIEISEPANPTITGNCYTETPLVFVAISGNYAFAVAGSDPLAVIDISDPEHPTLVGTGGTLNYGNDVAISGDYAFIADDSYGLAVIDISDPANPTNAGRYNTPSMARRVALSGDHAYVADMYSGLQVIDISDPASPARVGSLSTAAEAMDVAVSGDYAFAACSWAGLQVIDISDPAKPTLAGSYDASDYASAITVSGNHAFMLDSGSLQVIDISDPTNPTIAGTIAISAGGWDVAVSGNYAFMTDNYSNLLLVIDISDPTNPTPAAIYVTPGEAGGVTVWGEYALVAGGWWGLQMIQVFQREVEADNNVGRSLAVDAANDTIFAARLRTTQTDSVTLELSSDGGAHWLGIVPGGGWSQFAAAGTDLMWRSTHTWTAPGVNPAVTRLEIDWLVEAALIDSIVDVPDDQGGWVRAHFTRSGRDFASEATLPITSYGLWRRVDSMALVAALEAHASTASGKGADDDEPELGGLPVIAYQGRTFVRSRPGVAAASLPPGTWELVVSVPAIQQDAYIAAVPTVADSSASGSHHTVFVATAHTTTPSIWYVSEPDSGYSVDNIAPGVPEGFIVAYNTGSGNRLTWDPCTDSDFQYFRIYRSLDPAFVPAPENMVDATAETEWTDTEYTVGGIYYKITALDHAGNESDPASPESTTGVDDQAIPGAFSLYQNIPNPFNPTTTIRFDLPVRAHVKLAIYNVKGQLIRVLLEGEIAAGRREVMWDGKDSTGRGVASGIYFYNLQTPTFNESRKTILLK